MPVARSVTLTHEYVLERERDLPPEDQTVFLLKTFTNSFLMKVLRLMNSSPIAGMEVLARSGIAGWRNLRNTEGAEVEFMHESKSITLHGVPIPRPMADKCFDMLEPRDITELGNALADVNGITEDDAKN